MKRKRGLPFRVVPVLAAGLGRVAARWVRALAAAHTRSSSRLFARRTQNATGPRRGCTARPVQNRTPTQRARPVRHSRNRPQLREKKKRKNRPTQGAAPARRERRASREKEPPLSVTFIPRVCKCPGSKGPVGGATLAHWSGEKGGVYFSGSGHCTRGSAIFTKTKRLGRQFRRPFGVALQQEEEEEVEAMVGGCSKMAAV